MHILNEFIQCRVETWPVQIFSTHYAVFTPSARACCPFFEINVDIYSWMNPPTQSRDQPPKHLSGCLGKWSVKVGNIKINAYYMAKVWEESLLIKHVALINNGDSLLLSKQQQQRQSLHIKINFPALDAAPLCVAGSLPPSLIWFAGEAWYGGGMRPRNSALLRWLCNGNGNVCVSFLIFSRCLFCKTGTSAGGAPSPSLSLSLPFCSTFLQVNAT